MQSIKIIEKFSSFVEFRSLIVNKNFTVRETTRHNQLGDV